MSSFKDVKDILSNLDVTGGSLAGRGDEHPVGDYDEHTNTENVNLYWHIRNKSVISEEYFYRDLQQFALEVRGKVVSVEGINKIASPSGYPVPEGHSFNVPPKSGTTGDILDYEARVVKHPRPVTVTPIPMSYVLSSSTIIPEEPPTEP